MGHPETKSHSQPDHSGKHESLFSKEGRRFAWIRFVFVVVAVYILLWHGHALFAWIAASLPLLLPLAVTLLSIFTRAVDIRSYESVLRISNDVAIGIISFDIWAVSASRSDLTGRILA